MIDAKDIVSLAVAGGSVGLSMGAAFLFVRWLAAFIAGRVDVKTANLDAGTAQLIAGLERRVSEMTEREHAREERMDQIEDELRECKRRDSEKEAEIMRLKAMMQGYGDAKQRVQTERAADKQEKGE